MKHGIFSSKDLNEVKKFLEDAHKKWASFGTIAGLVYNPVDGYVLMYWYNEK
jgi:hypothetical protein